MTSRPPVSPESGQRVLAAFRRAAVESPAYRVLLREHSVNPDAITDLETFLRWCPVLNKQSTFGRFPIDDLAVPGTLDELANVLPSSGHGGHFSFGLETRAQSAAAAAFVDDALDTAFQVKSRRTLAVNCLPMGVGVSSACMAIATVSVREDVAVAVIERFGPHFDQVLLISDPLFLPRLLAYGATRGTAWRRHDTRLVLGGEVFGESFRDYAGRQLGYSPEDLDTGVIRSSMGAAELGLHLLHETPATIALRRRAARHPQFSADLLGTPAPLRPTPMLLAYDHARIFVEVVDPDASGFGLLTITLLDPRVPVPLVRYQPGDIAALVDAADVQAAAQHDGLAPGSIPWPLVALRGRQGDLLRNGSHLSVYKEALFAADDVASIVTGAYRAEIDGQGVAALHVQLRPGINAGASAEDTVLRVLAPEDRPSRVRLWRYETFPFGMLLDYERKFLYGVRSVSPL